MIKQHVLETHHNKIRKLREIIQAFTIMLKSIYLFGKIYSKISRKVQ